MIKVLVTDDSAFMRKLLSDIINSDPHLEVIGTARDGKDLLDKISDLKPDVITLDISMPVMDGVTALRKIMSDNPLPVIMISALSDEENTFTCLELGAVDFIPKTSGIISIDMTKKRDIIIDKIKAAARAKIDVGTPEQDASFATPAQAARDGIVVMGASTGGPRAIESILQAFSRNFPVPILISQHMPSEFTRAFAERLNKNCALEVKEAQSGEEVRKGVAYVAPGDFRMEVQRKSDKIRISLSKDTIMPGNRHIDALMRSASDAFKENCIGILLSGMGEDGTEGLRYIKQHKGRTIVQDEGSCVVPTMPKNAINAGVVDKVIPLQGIAKEIMGLL